MKAYILKTDMKGLKSPVWRRIVVPEGKAMKALGYSKRQNAKKCFY